MIKQIIKLNNNNIFFYIYSNNILIIFIKNNFNYIYFKFKINLQYMFNSFNRIFNFLENTLLLHNNNLNYYMKLYNIGLGYKNFIYKNILYIYLGDSNYYKIKFSKNIIIICKKNQLYFFSKFKDFLLNFVNKLTSLKKINLYKGKGIIPYSNFKFMKLKKGKKKN